MCKQASVDQRAMPQRVVELLACWKGQYARCCNGEIWNAIPLGLMWILWREWNRWTFEGLERSMLEVKFILLCLSYDWMASLSSHSPSLLDFLYYCNLC